MRNDNNTDSVDRDRARTQPPPFDGGEISSLREELRALKEELSRRIAYQKDFREGVFQMLHDLDKGERDLDEACRKLKDTRDQLVQSSKMTALGELAAGLAHELNQPLTVIKGLSLSLLRSGEDLPVNREKLQLIADASNRMELIIKHLRVFSRSDSAEMVPVDINDIINDAFVMVRELLVDNGIEAEMDISSLPLIQGSPNRLEQVVINLVTNAKDAMPGGGRLRISTMPLVAGGRKFVRLSIRDSGGGIKKEHLGRIFDPFFTTKEPGKGTGLGLSISYGIIKEHSGDITVESSPEGTTFHITLPAAQ
ncbi:MAG: ATP-binding protein [Deltaproteobacteria bacterium]|nr:ATP-binding protein [Deltaproteobacteria bacterium]